MSNKNKPNKILQNHPIGCLGYDTSAKDRENNIPRDSNGLNPIIENHIQNVQPAAVYKAACIDFYLKRYKCKLITNEFRYGSLQLVTDLLILTQRNTISIEIKSEYDDLRRVKNQVQESIKNFNLTIVFADYKHKDALIKLLPIDAGITIFNGERCEVVRPPKRKIVVSQELVSSIPASYLKTFFKIKDNLDSDKLRRYVLDQFGNHILECFRAYLLQKFSTNYYRFMLDRGQYTHIEDIPTLTMKDLIEIK